MSYLCPSAPDVRQYAVALCKDVTDNYGHLRRSHLAWIAAALAVFGG